MSMNCEGCLARCKGECCANVPLPARLFKDHEAEKEITEMIDIGEQLGEPYVVPVTADGRCPFMDDTFHCSIYEDRPIVCRKFGDESCTFTTCSWQDKDGRIRSRQERRFLDRVFIERQKKTMRRLCDGNATQEDIEQVQGARASLSEGI